MQNDINITKRILKIALPAIVSNITVPLLSLADTAIIGHLNNVLYIGAIAVAGSIFSLTYWLFGFLRASTSGFTAQGNGANDNSKIVEALLRSSILSLFIGLTILLLQEPILHCALYIISPSPEITEYATIYFNICIWGAPIVLILYGINGWFIGLQKTHITMIIALIQNIINIILSIVFVFVFHMQVAGVALGTVSAQYIGLGLSIWFIFNKKTRTRYNITKKIFNKSYIITIFWNSKDFFIINKDIFLRTLCLIAVTLWFTSASARQSVDILAANTILLQFFYFFSYFIDGFANAGESLAGYYVGAQDNNGCRLMIKSLFFLGIILTLIFTLIYCIFGNVFLSLLTNVSMVLTTSSKYLGWAMIIPLCGFTTFLWDGIYIGFTATRHLLLSMFFAATIYFALYILVSELLGNDGLWLSFCVYLSLRGIIQTIFYYFSKTFRI